MQEREWRSALRQAGARSKLAASFSSSPPSQAPAATEPHPARKPAPLLGQMTVLGSTRCPATLRPPTPSVKIVRESTPAAADVPTPAEPTAPVIAAPPAAVPTLPAAPPSTIAAAPAAAIAVPAPAAAPEPRPAAPARRTVVQMLKAQVAQRIDAREAAAAQRQARARCALVAASRPRPRELTAQLTPPRHPHNAPIYVPVGDAYLITKPATTATATAMISAAACPVPVRPAALSSPASAAVNDDDTLGWDNPEPPPPPPSRAPQPAPRPALLLPESPKPPTRRSSSEGADASPLDDGSPGGGAAASSAPPSTASAPDDATSDEARSDGADANADATGIFTDMMPPSVFAGHASRGELMAHVTTIEPLRVEPLLQVVPLQVGPLFPEALGFVASHPIAPDDTDAFAVAEPSAEAPRRRCRRNPFSAIGRAARCLWRTKIAACFGGTQVSPSG
ncbi:hypothetical protein Rsub_09150 [Raphidocelis subcapitata]|uniref:Uncharacterized protein n=1 Tax=Raphidocelis subcapitata TaxID=307507 RepID=A0A2V0PH84_9CHLO|nr:hypothetical protein Rsub_09150 [Raphidocelis subcapitata]|eukprot:GBF96567.1 hypothetical protein Rsub_09150 [Raphidocelis subcapitata]